MIHVDGRTESSTRVESGGALAWRAWRLGSYDRLGIKWLKSRSKVHDKTKHLVNDFSDLRGYYTGYGSYKSIYNKLLQSCL